MLWVACIVGSIYTICGSMRCRQQISQVVHAMGTYLKYCVQIIQVMYTVGTRLMYFVHILYLCTVCRYHR